MERFILRFASPSALVVGLMFFVACGSGRRPAGGEHGVVILPDLGSETPSTELVILAPDSNELERREDVGLDQLALEEWGRVDCSQGPPFPFGCPCSEPGDCQTGFCIETSAGKQCTRVCVEECPAGWKCSEVTGLGPDTVFLCVDPFARLCRPCVDSGVCLGGQCVEYDNDGSSYCGTPCTSNEECPSGYSCQSMEAGSSQCVFSGGHCPCSEASVASAAQTGCSVSNEFGVCKGIRKCLEVGVPPVCDAPIPEEELCDGVDNDCDGFVDETPPACSGGKYCSCSPAPCQCICPEGFTSCGNVCADLKHDVAHCGDCFVECNAPEVKVATCDEGKCKAAVCNTGFADADGIFENGCECSVSAEVCDGLDNDCNGKVDDGAGLCGGEGECQGQCVDGLCVCPEGCQFCEGSCKPDAFFLTSPVHCGKCNNPCSANNFPGVLFATCKDGECVPGPCAPGWYDTDTDTPGCECFKTAVVEKCDGLDNNCDGNTDEEPVTDCKFPMVCQNGVCICDPEQPNLLLCDGECVDALTSPFHCGDCKTNCYQMGWKNVETYGCTDGQCVIKGCDAGFVDTDQIADNGCECLYTSPVEQCNGVDDDCDGLVDEEASGEGMICNTGMPPPCAEGKMVCSQGKLFCKPDIPPGTFLETCNGVDDDCNGEIDDAVPDAGLPCNVPLALGPCVEGKLVCKEGKMVCESVFEQFPEICDGVDSDCDGVVDDSPADAGLECDSTLPGKCKAGFTHCINGVIECVPIVSPGELDEVCNGLDDDCDGTADEENPGGGVPCLIPNKLGECAKGVTSCVGGDILCLGDVQPAEETCDGLDNDCDGKTDESVPGVGEPCQVEGKLGECAKGTMLCGPNGLTCTQTVQPAPEKCDGLDNNCNGEVDDGNPEGGGACILDNLFGPCKQGMITCLDGKLTCTQTNFGSPEQCDGQDNDCNGMVDDNPGDVGGDCQVPGTFGICSNGIIVCQDGKKTCKQIIFGNQESCNGQDDNCDGITDEEGSIGCSTWFYDGDGDGYAINGATSKCLCSPSYPYTATNQGDCNDNSDAVYPDALEQCDGQDNDCDFQTDEEGALGCKTYYRDQDGDGYGTSESKCLCSPSYPYTATNQGDCNDNSGAIHPSAIEQCDGQDNDCDFQTDEEGALGCKTYYRDQDGDGYGTFDSKCLCSPSYPYMATNQGDCNDNSGAVHPNATEQCDGQDNDCDFQTDEEGALGCKTYYRDQDGDGYGTSDSKCLCGPSGNYSATKSGDCNDSSFSINPGATEKCDGVDDNCNGVKDDGASCPSGYSCIDGACQKLCSDITIDASQATIHTGSGGPSAYYPSCWDHWNYAGWHAGTGVNGHNVRWTWTSTCPIPSPSNPLNYPTENARWTFTTAVEGYYDINVKIPEPKYVCNVGSKPGSQRYADDVYYGLARSGEVGKISGPWSTSLFKGLWMPVFFNVHLKKGTHTLILYDHGSTAGGACGDPYGTSSRFVFVDSVQVKCK